MVLLGFLVVCACWSTTWYAIRLCLRGYPPLYGASLRFLASALVIALGLALWSRLRRPSSAPAAVGEGGGALAKPSERAVPRGPHRALVLAGVANGVAYAMLYLAEQTITGGTAAVISATSPFFTALVARLCGLERFVPRRLLGVLLGFAGVVVMMADGFDRSLTHVWAMVLVAFASAVLWPAYGVILKRCASAVPPLRASVTLLCWSGLTLLCLAVLRGEPFPTPLSYPLQAHLGLVYLALIGTIVAWSVYLWLLQRMDLTVLSTMGLIEPVLALAIDLVAGDAALGWRGYAGAALVLLGVGLAALGADLPRLWRALRRVLSFKPSGKPSFKPSGEPAGRSEGPPKAFAVTARPAPLSHNAVGQALGGQGQAGMDGAVEA